MKSNVFFALFALLAGILNAHASSKTEAQTYALNCLTNIFVKSGDIWYTSRTSGSITISPTGGTLLQGVTLIEFKELSFSYDDIPISETEKLNGVTDKLIVMAMWKHDRSWNKGKWGEWSGGAKSNTSSAILGMIATPLVADWRMTFTRKNGSWTQYQLGGFSTNRQQTLNLIDQAVHGKILESNMENEKKSAPPSIPLTPNTSAPSTPKPKPSITAKLKGVIEEEGKLTIQTDKGEFYEGKNTPYGKVISVTRDQVETDEQTINIVDR